MRDIEIYIHIAFYNFGIFQYIFYTSIYFWKPLFVSNMYHTYFCTSLLVTNCSEVTHSVPNDLSLYLDYSPEGP